MMLGAKDAAAETQAAMATIRIIMAVQAPASALRRGATHLFPAGCAASETRTIRLHLNGLPDSCDSWNVE